jgi:hypothetical protein
MAVVALDVLVLLPPPSGATVDRLALVDLHAVGRTLWRRLLHPKEPMNAGQDMLVLTRDLGQVVFTEYDAANDQFVIGFDGRLFSAHSFEMAVAKARNWAEHNSGSKPMRRP